VTRLVTSGAEIYSAAPPAGDTTALKEAGAPDGWMEQAGMARTTSGQRSGNACWSTTGGAGRITFPISGALERGYYARVYIKVVSAPSLAPFDVLDFQSLVRVAVNTNGTVSFVGSGVQSAVIAGDGQWHRLELFVFFSATQASTSYSLRMDGVQFDSGGNSVNLTFVPGALNIGDSSQTGVSVLFDDVALNDSQGASNNSWPGDGYVIVLKPSVDNSRGSWTGGAGGTTSLFDALNNTPPIGAVAPGTNLQQIRANAIATTGVFDTESFIAAGAAAGSTAVLAFVVASHGE